MFKIGDKIMYPMHGAGIINRIEQQEVLGQLKDYFVLQMPMGSVTIMVPTGSLNELGVRALIPKEEIEKVLNSFADKEFIENTNWNKRYRENILKLKSSSIYDVVDVYKVLAKRDRDKGLSTGERKMFTNAKQILFSELILAGNMELVDVEKIIDAAVSEYIAMS